MSYIIFDLEATCWENESDKKRTNEVIEIGAVKLSDTLDQIDEFSLFVKPTEHPELSKFCKKLTTIQQRDVDGAGLFSVVVPKFAKWAEGCALYSWGYYDKLQLLREGSRKLLPHSYEKLNTTLFRHHSLKHEFADIKNIKPCGMEKALELLGLPLVGTHHRGIADARNITKIFIGVFDFLNLKS